LSTTKPLNALVELIRPDCEKIEKVRPEIEVSFLDKTVEQWRYVEMEAEM
jgi:hypothetical protein